MDSQSQASTASQMENTHNIDCSHGERSKHGELNDDSSTDFEGDVTRDNLQRWNNVATIRNNVATLPSVLCLKSSLLIDVFHVL